MRKRQNLHRSGILEIYVLLSRHNFFETAHYINKRTHVFLLPLEGTRRKIILQPSTNNRFLPRLRNVVTSKKNNNNRLNNNWYSHACICILHCDLSDLIESSRLGTAICEVAKRLRNGRHGFCFVSLNKHLKTSFYSNSLI